MARKPAAEDIQPAAQPGGVAQDAAPEPIPLALAPLIAPYKKKGRVKLRIERLPRRARLSQGQNNGDGSWSLMLDELEDLQYLPAKGSDEAPVLGIRIVSLEAGDASTLAVLDYAVPSQARAAREADEELPAARKSSDDTESRRLRSELAKAQAALAVRESELAAARYEAEEARTQIPRQTAEKELASAREAWEVELEARLAALTNNKADDLQENRESWRRETEAALAKAEKEWQAAEAERLAAAEARWKEKSARTLTQSRAEADALRSDSAEFSRLREKIDALQFALTKSEGELAKVRADAAAAEDRARKTLTQSRTEADALRADSTELTRMREKIDALQSSLTKRESEFAKLRNESAQAEERARKDISQARAEADALRGDDAELERVRERLARLQASLTTRDKELAQARADVVEAENRGHKDVETALAKAEKAWKAEEEGRLQVAEARWNEQASRAQTETRNHVKDRDDELKRLSNELERAQKALADREAAEKDARGSADDARRDAKRALEDALAKADSEKNAIEARWQEQFAQAIGAVTAQLGRSEKALADARSEIESLRGGDSQIERLRKEHADLKTNLAAQDSELQRARAAVEDERARAKRSMEEALARAESLWQSNEAARFVAAEKRWKEQSRDAMEQAASHAQRAEAVQSKLHAQDELLRTRGVEYQRSRDECAALRDALAQRENELAQVRWTLIQTRERKASEPAPAPARTEQIWSAETLQKLNKPIGVPRDRLFDPHNTLGEAEPEAAEAPSRRIGRDLVAVVIVAMVVVAGAVRFAPDSWWAAIMPAASQSQPSKPHIAPVAQPTPAPSLPEATVARSANLRSGPSKTADAVATLPKGTKVAVVAHHGNWVQIRSSAQDGKKVLEGWVFNTFLSASSKAAAKSP